MPVYRETPEVRKDAQNARNEGKAKSSGRTSSGNNQWSADTSPGSALSDEGSLANGARKYRSQVWYSTPAKG